MARLTDFHRQQQAMEEATDSEYVVSQKLA
jgi:hypothetical protein